MIEFVNQERQKKGINTLKYDPLLSLMAVLKARDMVKNRYFGHDSPTLGRLQNMLENMGLSSYDNVGENLAMNSDGMLETFKGLMSSPSHKKNILYEGYTHFGYGFGSFERSFKGAFSYIYVQVFACKKSLIDKEDMVRIKSLPSAKP